MQQRTDGDPVLPIKLLAKTGFWWVFIFFGITELFFQGRSILELIINSSGITLPISLLDIRNKGTSLWSIKIPKESNAIGMDLSKLNLLR